ncbi:MAG: hypothetical protein Kow0013_14020 [Pararhodobacter sp.]
MFAHAAAQGALAEGPDDLTAISRMSDERAAPEGARPPSVLTPNHYPLLIH